MSNLLYLNHSDFSLQDGPNGKVVCTSIAGYSLVLFYSTDCVYCHSFIPIWKTIPTKIAGCQFGLVNVSKNKQLVNMSQQSISPLTHVPYVLLYINGKPFVRYDGERTEIGIKNFIKDISTKMSSSNKQQFVASKPKTNEEDKIPAYCLGKPKCDNNVCYLSYDKAYA